MPYLCAALLVISVLLLTPHALAGERTKPFLQDVATVYTHEDGLPEAAVCRLQLDDERAVVACTGAGRFALKGDRWACVDASPANAEAGEQTPEGLWIDGERHYPADDHYSWSPRRVAAMVTDTQGQVIFGCREGLGVRHADGSWTLYTGREGLPSNQFVCAAASPDGSVWFGTLEGCFRFQDGRFAWRAGRRWLPDNRVRDIVVDAKGTVWVATDAGISRIERRGMTLEEKAAYFVRQTEARHVRDSFVADCRLTKQYDVNSWVPKISDNDGEYTSLYGVSQILRYAVTGDAEARRLAKRSFEACKWLVDITGNGFVARVIIPEDWPEPVNEQYGPEYNARMRAKDPFWKLITPRFVESADGTHLWKCDTSSDELIGHYLIYALYYDLVAETADEKRAVREVVNDVTGHLVRNGYLLRDHDGEPTRWGNFSPAYLNSAKGWEQRGLNSLMILALLKAAEHITGDREYGKHATKLMSEHQYHVNAMQSKIYFPPDYVVPWDNNLCLMSWYLLMRYEDNPELMLQWRLALEHAWLHASKQKNACWNFLYAGCAQRFEQLAETGFFDNCFPELGPYTEQMLAQFEDFDPKVTHNLETLRGIPLDLIGYHMDNTARLDVIFDPQPGQTIGVGVPQARGWAHDGFALPIEERGHVRLDRSGFNLNQTEDGGWAEHEGTFFLLPYYLGVYHGFIE